MHFAGLYIYHQHNTCVYGIVEIKACLVECSALIQIADYQSIYFCQESCTYIYKILLYCVCLCVFVWVSGCVFV